MAQQSNTATTAADALHQHIETRRDDPTAPLWLGTDIETDDSVTIDRDHWFNPLLITAGTRRGKTTLCHQLAAQQRVSNGGLCYVSGTSQPVDGPRSTDRTGTIIVPDAARIDQAAIDTVPADIGTATTNYTALLGTGTGTTANTPLISSLIEQLLRNRYRQSGPDATPATLVLDGIEHRVDLDRLALDQLLAEAGALRLQVIIATQTLAHLPSAAQYPLNNHVQTHITGHVSPDDAAHFERVYTTPTADEFGRLPRYHWWLCDNTPDGRREAQFRTAPPSDRTQLLDEERRPV
jgi:hypothetical protein